MATHARTDASVVRQLAGLLICGLLWLMGGCPAAGPGTTGCASDADCDDGRACTSDACGADGVCVNDATSCPEGQVIDVRSEPDAVVSALDIESKITSVSIASPPVVEFTVTTAEGAPVTGIGSLWEEDNRYVRFTLTKLNPGSNGDPNVWTAYTRDTINDGSAPPDYDTGSSLIDHGDGTYTFAFNTDVAAVSGVSYEPTLSHRVAGQIGSSSSLLEAQNLFMDFVPAGGSVTETRNIATVDSCNECHGRLVMHGRRFVAEYCVNCHTPELAQGEGDMKSMIHRIHTAQKFDVLDDGIDYSEVTYPQDVNNCRKCHSAEDAATPDGDNWKNVPNMVACGSCHTKVNFETGENHAGGAQTNNSACATCHPASSIEEYHTSSYATPNNPDVPDGLSTFSYEIAEARVDASNVLEIDLSILRDGAPMDLLNIPADVTNTPSFLFGYSAGPQDGIENPNDYNNLGRTAGQPESANLVDLIDGGSVAASASEGVYTVTVPDAFPVGATLRTVALQSRFRQLVEDEQVDRRTVSVVKPVTGDAQRRVIVDPAKCADCHESLQLHGGSRVVEAASDPAQPEVCVLCHNPNLSSSGRTANPEEELQEDTVAALGDDPLTYPERTQHFKNLIHGIHGSQRRTTDYEFVRNRLNGLYYNWNEVTFPGELNNCLTCHFEGTYELPLPDGVLMSTEWTTTGDTAEGRDAILDARDNVPTGTDLVNTPTAGTCYMCHDSESAVAHMEQNGGQINVFLREAPVIGTDYISAGADALTRDQVVAGNMTEACAVCHGAGRIADLSTAHGLK